MRKRSMEWCSLSVAHPLRTHHLSLLQSSLGEFEEFVLQTSPRESNVRDQNQNDRFWW